jgi:hypothetical protein
VTATTRKGAGKMDAHTQRAKGRERLRKNFYHPWKALREVEDDPGLLEEARQAPAGSRAWRRALLYHEALRVLAVSMRK